MTSVSGTLPRATKADPSNILYMSLTRFAPCRPFHFDVCDVTEGAEVVSASLSSDSSPEIESSVDRELDLLP